jgi:hypothetical protein
MPTPSLSDVAENLAEYVYHHTRKQSDDVYHAGMRLMELIDAFETLQRESTALRDLVRGKAAPIDTFTLDDALDSVDRAAVDFRQQMQELRA